MRSCFHRSVLQTLDKSAAAFPLISADFFPGKGTSSAVFSLNCQVNIVENTSDHIPRIQRWTWNLSSSTTNTTSLSCHGIEKSSEPAGFDILGTVLFYFASDQPALPRPRRFLSFFRGSRGARGRGKLFTCAFWFWSPPMIRAPELTRQK